MGVPRTGSARWSLATHSDNGNMCSLVNLGSRPAVDVRVQLLEGPLQRQCGMVVFARIDPGGAVDVYRFSAERDPHGWDRVTVTWRDAGWLPRRRLQWDSDGQPRRASGRIRSRLGGSSHRRESPR
jgi:hypothetical protein